MKKTYRNIGIIILVILLLGGGLFAVSKIEPKQDEVVTPDLPDTITVYQTEKDNIVSVTVTNPEETYTLALQNETWIVTKDPSVVLHAPSVESLLYECANIVGQDMVSENAQDLSPYGLDKPERTVEIKLKDGTTVKILIGAATFENSVSYLMVEGETKVYTKSTSGCNTLTGSLSALMDNNIYTMDAEEIGFIKIARTGGETITLEKVKLSQEGEADAFEWTMKTPLHKKTNAYRLQNDLFTNLLSQKAVSVIPIPESGKDYGFNNPRAVYTIASQDKSKSYTVTVGKKEESGTYIRLKGNQSVYLVATEKLDFLELSYFDLIDKLVHIENIKDVAEVHLTGLNKTFTMIVPASDDGAYKINNKEIEKDDFTTAYQAVIGLILDDFTATGGGETAFTITYKKRDGSQTVVKCLSFDERNYLVKVNGEGNLLIRKRQIDSMIDIIESILEQ